jgi:tetraacyldisaccharide 4'-kinase
MFSWLRIIAILFFPLPLFYTLLVYLRNKLFDFGWFKSYKLPAIVISIGNIQLGGTGKTPMVQFLADILIERQQLPVILTRGYKRKSTKSIIITSANRHQITVDEIGDEPFVISRNLPEVTIGVDADRRRAALQVLKTNPNAIFILDDGFQHRRLQRDLDIVLVDCSHWSSFPVLFPLTYFRDLPSSLKRAQTIILTHWENSHPESEKLSRQLSSHYQVPVFQGRYEAIALKGIFQAETRMLDQLKNKKVTAFCGIAQPTAFFDSLTELGANICWRNVYPDHFNYRLKNVQEIAQEAKSAGAEYIITTEKDAVKFEAMKPSLSESWFFLQVGFAIQEKDEFTSFLTDHLLQVDETRNK